MQKQRTYNNAHYRTDEMRYRISNFFRMSISIFNFSHKMKKMNYLNKDKESSSISTWNL